MPKTERTYIRLFIGLKTKGDTEILLAEFQQIARLQPSDGIAAFYLGRAYQQIKRLDAASDAYLKAMELNFSNRWLPFNLAATYRKLQDFSSAAHWYQEAINQDQEWEAAFYYLGHSLIN